MLERLQTPARFLAAGLGNSLVTLFFYQLLVIIMSATAAYACTWILGLIIVAVTYPKLVFRTDASVTRRLHLVATYVLTFAVGLLLTRYLETAEVNPRLIILITMAVTTVLNYVLGRYVLSRPQSIIKSTPR